MVTFLEDQREFLTIKLFIEELLGYHSHIILQYVKFSLEKVVE